MQRALRPGCGWASFGLQHPWLSLRESFKPLEQKDEILTANATAILLQQSCKHAARGWFTTEFGLAI